MIKVIVIDDHPVVREGLKQISELGILSLGKRITGRRRRSLKINLSLSVAF